MKVSIISSSIDPTNGWGNITYELSKCLKDEVDLTILLPKGETTDLDVKTVEMSSRLKFPSKNPLSYLALLNASRKVPRSDIIHSLFAYPYAIPGAVAAKRGKLPFIVGAQGTYGVRPFQYAVDGRLLSWAYRSADIVHAPSSYTAERIKKGSGISQVRVIENAVNYDRFSKSLDLSRLQKEYPGKIILSVGALKPRKGQHVMIEAFQKVRKEIPDAEYLIIGDGGKGYKKQLHKLAEDVPNIHFLGIKKGKELVTYYQFCDLYAHTPINIDDVFEGFGIVYLEAGACGKAVIGSDSGGVSSAIKDGRTGILVPEADSDATAEAILKLLSDEKLRDKLGSENRKWAKQNDWKAYSKKILNFYGELYDEKN